MKSLTSSADKLLLTVYYKTPIMNDINGQIMPAYFEMWYPNPLSFTLN